MTDAKPEGFIRSRAAFLFVLVAASVANVTACAEAGLEPAAAPKDEAHPMLGELAPDFELDSANGGESVSLAAHRGKVVIVDFWATWCEPCRVSFPEYQAIADRMSGKVVVIGISEDDDPAAISSFARDADVSFPLVWDEDKSLAAAYKPSAMPTSFIVDPNGLVRYVHLGFRAGDGTHIEKRIREILE
jgi:peroxiredoxin